MQGMIDNKFVFIIDNFVVSFSILAFNYEFYK